MQRATCGGERGVDSEYCPGDVAACEAEKCEARLHTGVAELTCPQERLFGRVEVTLAKPNLSQLGEREALVGEIEGRCFLDGPLGFDSALRPRAAPDQNRRTMGTTDRLRGSRKPPCPVIGPSQKSVGLSGGGSIPPSADMPASSSRPWKITALRGAKSSLVVVEERLVVL